MTHTISINGERYIHPDGTTHLVSIGSPGTAEPSWVAQARARGVQVVRLEFDNVESSIHGQAPTQADFTQVTDLARHALSERRAHVHLHCSEGISRSTAAALGVLAVFHPGEEEEQIAARLLTLRPQAQPNRRMLRHLYREFDLNMLGEFPRPR
ncbi:hypothetical protein [Deinococcus soli (ex Cha et al. 2016)]|uniref:Uncharacterized protein n=2 Tax=Deinococcus soli (ex Cha et al. 2016) TaxID=1309411 RepID=A0ACC6KKW4_9DEIO|nr:hypothetical protein [Deinococcus soli (ex Cha et al. 2016)]MDR6218649.1 putative protein tyrosine phosphatase [Deinococcus soli (ex Cha et al. 2016)]MDR6328446.1 putative protein tyrosine phosphatase [Deinococcus soli (ex Cha et al. 2016)]MDR6753057.1 putative protein tyrosine phosphatase [Deinococcus soli (ex Cha et al. 2016)]